MTERPRSDVDSDGRVRAALSSIGAHARRANLVRAEQLSDALGCLEADALSLSQREAAVRSAHQLAGSAGTFGQEPASTLASWFERFFSGHTPQDRENVAHARRQLAELRRSLDDPPDLD
ncbi:MAG TPA: Hpt domain-containing protein [Microlunatus sp.]